MIWYIIAGIAAGLAIGLMIFTYLRDRRYERKRVLEAMSPGLREEIEAERSASLARREHFKKALEKAVENEKKK